MGADLHFNPPAPKELWEQVRDLQKDLREQRLESSKLAQENRQLREELAVFHKAIQSNT